MNTIIKIKRIYQPCEKTDGYRVLVDRLWPRGVKKENAAIDIWIKEIGPSNALRKWFNHDAAKWKTFCSKYEKELQSSPALPQINSLLKDKKIVTFLYSAKDEEHNQAEALKAFLMKKN